MANKLIQLTDGVDSIHTKNTVTKVVDINENSTYEDDLIAYPFIATIYSHGNYYSLFVYGSSTYSKTYTEHGEMSILKSNARQITAVNMQGGKVIALTFLL